MFDFWTMQVNKKYELWNRLTIRENAIKLYIRK